MLNIQIETSELETTLHGVSAALGDLSPVWRDVQDIFVAMMAQQFATEGGAGGTRWEPLSPTYAARKQREVGSLPILQYSGRLQRSLTSKRDAEHIFNHGPSWAEYGTSVPYARAHHYGYPPRNLPARPVIPTWSQDEGERIVDALLAHILRSARRGR